VPTYTLQAANGKTYTVEGPPGVSERDLIRFVTQQIYEEERRAAESKQPKPEEEFGALDTAKQFAKTFGLQAAPVAGGIAGFGAAAQAAAPAAAVSPLIPLAAGVVGGIAGAFGAGKAQEEILERMPETTKALGIDPESLAKGREEAPWATKSAEILSQLVAFKPSLKAFQSTKDLADELAQEIWYARRVAAANAAIGAVTAAGQQGLSGQPLDLQYIAENAALNAVLQNPTKYGEMLERAGRAVVPTPAAKPTPPREPPKEITEQPRLPFGDEQMEMDLGDVPKEIVQEYPELFVPVPVLDKKGQPTGKVRYEFRSPETEVAPGQAAFDFETAPPEAPPSARAKEEIEVPLEDEVTGQMGLDFRPPVAPMRGEQLELPLPGQMEMDLGPIPAPREEPLPVETEPVRDTRQMELDFAAMQQQDLPLTMPYAGQQDMFQAGEPLPPGGRLPEAAPEPVSEGPAVAPGQMAFDLPGTPIEQLSPRDQILRAFQISRIHTDKELRSATDLPYKDYVAEINKLKKEGVIARAPDDKRWVLTKPEVIKTPRTDITEQQALPLATAEGETLPPGGRLTEAPVKAAEVPPQGEQLGFDFEKSKVVKLKTKKQKAEVEQPLGAVFLARGRYTLDETPYGYLEFNNGKIVEFYKFDTDQWYVTGTGADAAPIGKTFDEAAQNIYRKELSGETLPGVDEARRKQILEARTGSKKSKDLSFLERREEELALEEDAVDYGSEDLDVRAARGRKSKLATTDAGTDRASVSMLTRPGAAPATGARDIGTAGVGGVGGRPDASSAGESAGKPSLRDPTRDTSAPVEPGQLLREFEQIEKGKAVSARIAPYFEFVEPATQPPITLPRRETLINTDTASPRAVSAVQEGNLGKALYALMDEAGGDIRGGQTPLPQAQPSPLRDLAKALFNTIERTDDRSAIIAAEQKRFAREVGRSLTDDEKNGIADLINNDYDLTKYDFTDADGNLTQAGLLVKRFKPEYERMVDLPRGAKVDRMTGELVDLGGKPIPSSAFGGASVVVESPKLRGKGKTEIDRLKSQNKLAEYDPETNTFYFTQAGLNDRTILHEMTHAGTVKVLRQFEKSPDLLTTRQREGAKQVNDIFNATKEQLGGKFKDAYDNVYEFVSNAATNADFQKALSEIRSSDIGVTPRSRARSMWDAFTNALAKMFKLDKYTRVYEKPLSTRVRGAESGDNALLQASMAIKDILAVPKKGIDVKALAAKAAQKEELKSIKDIQYRLVTRTEGTSYPQKGNNKALLRTAWEAITTPQGREKIVANIQNYARPAKNLQDQLRRGGVDTTIYDDMTAAGALAETKYMQMQGLREDLNTNIEKYLQKSGVDFDQFLKDFHLFALARDEAQYRKAKWVVNSPLDDSTPIQGLFGTMTPAAERDAILKKLGEGVDKATGKQFRDRLEQLALPKDQGGYLDPMGSSPLREKVGPKPMATDISSPLYNVAGPYTKDQLGLIQNFYKERMQMYGSEIEPIFSAMKKIQDKTIEFNKEAGYHPPQLDAIIEFYRRPNYVPYKGDPNLKDANAIFDISGKRLSGNLSELQDKAEGRSTDSENPLLQVLADAAKAAGRVGRKDVGEEVARLINQGDIQGRKVVTIPFAERFANLVRKEDIEGTDRIFRHLPDGSVEVYKVSEPEMTMAIKGFVGDAGAFWQTMNRITSAIGRQHTLYNPAFAPYDYIRNMVTAATTVGAEVSPEMGARYAKSVTTKLLDGGIFKAMRVAMMHQKGDMAELARLKAQEGGKGFYTTLSNWMDVGGQASYRQAFNIRTLGEELANEVGTSGRMSKLDQVRRYFRVWSDAFEFAGRAAGYEAVLPDVLAKYKAQGKNIDSPAVREAAQREAAQYTKNIFNFNEVGVYGREAGSVFMFLRPALTSAVRFYDAFAPALGSVENALKLAPKSRTDVNEVYKRLSAQHQGQKTDAVKATLRRQAEQEVQQYLTNYRADFARRKKNAQMVSLALSAMGYGLYNISMMAAPKDEQGRNKVATDNMEIWSRNVRLPAFGLLGKDNEYFQIPWGWGFGSFGAFGAQAAGVVNGESTMKEMVKNTIPVVFESFLPLPVPKYSPVEHPWTFALGTVTPSFARPFLEYVTNVDAFGREIYKNRMNQFGDPYTGGETLPEMYGELSRIFADELGVTIEPRTLYFFINSYMDGIGRLASMGTGVGMSALGDRQFDPKYDIPAVGSFIGKSSSYDAREFADIRKKVEALGSKLDIYEDRPEQYDRFLERNPDADIIVGFYRSQVNGPLRKVQQEINEISGSPDYSAAEKRELIKELKKERDWIMRGIIDGVRDYGLN